MSRYTYSPEALRFATLGDLITYLPVYVNPKEIGAICEDVLVMPVILENSREFTVMSNATLL
jgi:hypothetical protein